MPLELSHKDHEIKEKQRRIASEQRCEVLPQNRHWRPASTWCSSVLSTLPVSHSTCELEEPLAVLAAFSAPAACLKNTSGSGCKAVCVLLSLWLSLAPKLKVFVCCAAEERVVLNCEGSLFCLSEQGGRFRGLWCG